MYELYMYPKWFRSLSVCFKYTAILAKFADGLTDGRKKTFCFTRDLKKGWAILKVNLWAQLALPGFLRITVR